jgi:non-ribosomal peptide synthase protein (TIGR01720 family)
VRRASRTTVLGGTDENVRELLAHRAVLLGPDVAPVFDPAAGGDPVDRFAAALDAGLIEPAGCVLLDPDPEVCAGIRARFPEVLAVPVPRSADAARAVLEHVWALDLPAAAEGGTQPGVGLRILAELTEPEAIHAAVGRGRHERSQGTYLPPRNERERTLAEILARLLGVERVGATDSFLELGGDSMTAIQVVSHAARVGIVLTPRRVLESESVATMATAPEAPAAQFDQGPVVGPVPLTSAQLWFFGNPAAAVPEPDHYNHPYYLTVRPGITPEQLRQALRTLVDHHDALRLRFTADAAGVWSQRAEAPGIEIPFEQADLSGLPADRRVAAAEELAAAAQRGIDLGSGPLVRAVHLRMGDGEPDRLLIICHHLVVDGISRGILLEDLSTLCEQAAAGEEARLPAKASSYKDWALAAAAYAESPKLLAEMPFWLRQLAGGPDAPAPRDFPDGANTFDAVDTVGAALNEEETAALQRLAGRELRSTLADVVLGISAAVLAQWSGDPTHCRFALAGHGRQEELGELDLSRTVGWFQVFAPMNLELRATDDRELLRSVHAQLEAVPANGLGFSLLESVRSGGSARRLFATGTRPQFSFNYLGEYSFADASAHTSLFGICLEPSGPAQGEGYVWPYVLDVMPGIVGRRLNIDIHYRHTIHRRETVAAIAREVADRLRALLS